MQLNRRKILQNTTIVVVILIVILVVLLGLNSSKYASIKKYDIPSRNPNAIVSKKPSFLGYANEMEVTITNDNEANLGEFVFNIAGNRVLIANISVKYKKNKINTGWFNSDENIKEEILKKGVILRDATIDTMLQNPTPAANSESMRKSIKKNLNKNLSSGKVEEVYFNKFIIQ